MTNPSNEFSEAANKAASQFRAMHDAMKGPKQATFDDFNVELNKVQHLIRVLGMQNLSADIVVDLQSVVEELRSIAIRLELDVLEREKKRRNREAQEDADRAAALRKELL